MTNILTVKNLVIKFYTFDGVVHALNNVSFDLDEELAKIHLPGRLVCRDSSEKKYSNAKPRKVNCLRAHPGHRRLRH